MPRIEHGPEETPSFELRARVTQNLPTPEGSEFWKREPSTIPGQIFLTTQNIEEATALTKAANAAGAHADPKALGWSAGTHSEPPSEEDWRNSKFRIAIREEALYEIVRQMEKNGYTEER